MSELEIREAELRADEESGTVSGIAVPYGREIRVGNIRERFERGAIEDTGSIKLFWQHREVIGRVIESEDREDGFWIKAQISDTTVGRDARALMRDGVVSKFSVGFVPVESRDDKGVTVRTRVDLREVSAVTFPAYSEAAIEQVREDSLQEKESPMADETVSSADLTEVRESIEELDRKVSSLNTRDEAEVIDRRSAAEMVKAIAKGDEDATRAYNETQERAYTGGTVADGGSTVKAAFVGDLTRIYDASSGVLSSVFGSAPLPSTGMQIEFAELNTNTVQVTEQANEGDDLAYGKVTLTSRTAPVRTFGGYIQLSRQQIERSTLPILQRSLDALALAAGARQKTEIRSAFNTVVTARQAVASNGGVVVLGSTLAAATYNNWVSVLVDGAVKYSQNNLNMDVLVVSASVFKKMAALAGSDGRPMLTLDGTGSNTVGRLNVTALNGSLAGVPVVLDADQSGDSAVFADGRAITVYTSPLVSLQDENIINLSKDFSVYRYAAFAPEIPTGIVPIKLAAS